jgi:EF-hand domain pair
LCSEEFLSLLIFGKSRVDEVVGKTRLLKPGMNGVYATALEITWKDSSTTKPEIRARFVKSNMWKPDPMMLEENERAYDVLAPMRNTELARVPPSFEPLSSYGSRESVCSMGKFLCSLIKSSMNVARRQRSHMVDAVLLMGGNIRGNAEYHPGSFFSLEMLEAEVKADEVVAVVPMPGWLLAQGIQATHAGEPISGWMQYDEGIVEDYNHDPPLVTHVAHEPIDMDRIYRVATKISDLRNGQSPPWSEYYTKNADVLPPKGAYVNVHAELMSYFARNLWRKLWDVVSIEIASKCDNASNGEVDECNLDERFAALDVSGDGVITVEEIQMALRDRLGYSVDDREKSLAEFVHSFADTTGDGKVTRQDLEVFCDEIPDLYKRDQWRLGTMQSSETSLR